MFIRHKARRQEQVRYWFCTVSFSAHFFSVCLLSSFCVVIWAMLPDANQWMDGWMAMLISKDKLLAFHYLPNAASILSVKSKQNAESNTEKCGVKSSIVISRNRLFWVLWSVDSQKKIFKYVATICQILRVNVPKWSKSRPSWGSLQRSRDA